MDLEGGKKSGNFSRRHLCMPPNVTLLLGPGRFVTLKEITCYEPSSDRTPINNTYLLRRPPSSRWTEATWEAGPDLRTGRADHTCSLVRSTEAAASEGRMVMVVIVGGQMRDGGITDSVELYDVASNELSQGEWRKMEFAK